MTNRVVKFSYHGVQSAFAIQDDSTKLYFIWCFNDELYANIMAHRIQIGDAKDQQTNWRAELSKLTLSFRTHDTEPPSKSELLRAMAAGQGLPFIDIPLVNPWEK